ncbi:hypothetical protein BJ508DRAFT_339991, partial [Ascobolus immersus RN42]
ISQSLFSAISQTSVEPVPSPELSPGALVTKQPNHQSVSPPYASGPTTTMSNPPPPLDDEPVFPVRPPTYHTRYSSLSLSVRTEILSKTDRDLHRTREALLASSLRNLIKRRPRTPQEEHDHKTLRLKETELMIKRTQLLDPSMTDQEAALHVLRTSAAWTGTEGGVRGQGPTAPVINTARDLVRFGGDTTGDDLGEERRQAEMARQRTLRMSEAISTEGASSYANPGRNRVVHPEGQKNRDGEGIYSPD